MSAKVGSQSGRHLSPAKRRIFQVLTVFLSLLVCFACLEIGLRLFGPAYCQFSNSTMNYYSNPRGYFDASRTNGGRVVYTVPVNEAGSPVRRIPDSLHSAEDVAAFLAREDTILGLGDSFTIGRGVRYEHTYLRRLEKMLVEDGKPVTIKNTAASGYDVNEICEVYDIHYQPGQHRLVIYGFVLNDFGLSSISEIVGSDYIDLNNGGNQYSVWRERCATGNFVCHVIETIRLDRVTRKAYIEAFRSQDAKDGFRSLRALKRSVQEDGGRLVIVLFPLLYEFDDYDFQEIHDKMADFSRKERIPLLDLLPVYSKYKAKDLWVHPTDHHPNEIAHRVAAEEIHAFLKRDGLLDLLPSE